MPSWESLIRIKPSPAWGSVGSVAGKGIFLNADSETLESGAIVTERDNKITGVRESLPDTFSIDRYIPKGDITYQPRVDELLLILMAHFQYVVRSGTGTFQFFRNPNSPNWTVNGTNYNIGSSTAAGTGNNVYSLDVDKFLGFSQVSAAVGGNGIRFTNGIVDKLVFNQKYAEDLKITSSFKFLAGSLFSYPAAFAPTSAFGSFSAYSRFVDYHGTITLGTNTYDIDGIQLNFDNKTSDRSKLGQQGWSRFPFSAHYISDGQIFMELQDNLNRFAPGVSFSLTSEWQITGQVGTIGIKVTQPNCYFRAGEPQIGGGEEVIENNKTYRAYPVAGSIGCPSTIVTVYTGTNLAGTLFS